MKPLPWLDSRAFQVLMQRYRRASKEPEIDDAFENVKWFIRIRSSLEVTGNTSIDTTRIQFDLESG